MTKLASLQAAVAFLTPLGGAAAPDSDALAWFPVVGAGMGLALGGCWMAASRIWPPAVAAAVVVSADLAFTGMLHFDGLVDSADGLLGHGDPQRRLQAMADPAAGAFGLGVGTSVVLLRWAALSALAPSPLLLAGLWTASRTAMVTAMRVLPYARPRGLASAFDADGPQVRMLPIAGGLALAMGLASAVRGRPARVPVVAGLAAAAGVAGWSMRKIGGFTGDVLGAAGMVAESVGLLVAAAGRP